MFYNPPMVNRNLGIRRSYINEATRVAEEILGRKLQTIVFANSRLHTEVILTYLQQANPAKPGKPEPIRGYRGGYLPGERREIERSLRDGRILGVVATNALELALVLDRSHTLEKIWSRMPVRATKLAACLRILESEGRSGMATPK